MDEIAYRLKLARTHFNDSPVINQWYVTWSHCYHADLYEDRLAQVIRRGRRQDSAAVIGADCNNNARMQRAWRYMLFHSQKIDCTRKRSSL